MCFARFGDARRLGRSPITNLWRLFSSSSKKNNTGIHDDDLKARREQVEQVRARVLNDGTNWDSLWKDGVTPWDLGKATPALVQELANRPSSFWKNRKSLRTLVPGCGTGYDLVTLKRHHNELIDAGHVQHAVVVGLDISETGLQKAAEEFQKATVDDDRPCEARTSTRVELVHGDFFDVSAWSIRHSFGGDDAAAGTLTMTGDKNHFDFIFDYTFFCALPPALRPKWGQQTANLLRPETGQLLTFMFPLIPVVPNAGKELQGPPFPVQALDYLQVLEPARMHMMTAEPYSSPDSVPARAEMELVCWWSRSTGSDMDKLE
jgi:SAM-dependent methyltransferase